MGNCFSCFKIPPSADSPSNTALEKDKEEAAGPCGRLSVHADTELGGPLTVVQEVQANGSSRGPAPSPTAALAAPLPLQAPGGEPVPSATPAPLAVPPPGPKGGGRSVFCPYPRLGRDSTPSETRIHSLFEAYRDPHEDAMLADGIERLCTDLSLSPDEFKVLVLAWRLEAERMCRFSRAEFVSGLRALRVDSLRGLQARLPEVAAEVAREPDQFKDLYRFTFRFGLDVEAGQRALPADMAACLWRLVFSLREPPILGRWLRFLEDHPHVRGIPRDTWNMFLNFAEAVGDDLSSYDDTEAWPSLFDDFVEFENDKANQNIAKDREGMRQLQEAD